MKTLKRILKWTGIVLALIVIVFVIAVFSRQHLKFDAPYPDLHASADSTVIAHGHYLVTGPAHCTGCHTDESFREAYFRGDEVPLHGNYAFPLPVGTIYTRNITNDKEHGIGRLTDQEIARTLRYGVGSDGRAILDFMPFYTMSDEDLTAIISYLRSLPPDPMEVPPNDYNFLGKAVVAFLIKPMGPLDVDRPKSVKADTTAAYGDYMANAISDCAGCHTTRDMMTGSFIGPRFAGFKGFEGDKPGIFFNAPNLTPDPETGHLSGWDFDIFRTRFRGGAKFEGTPMPG